MMPRRMCSPGAQGATERRDTLPALGTVQPRRAGGDRLLRGRVTPAPCAAHACRGRPEDPEFLTLEAYPGAQGATAASVETPDGAGTGI